MRRASDEAAFITLFKETCRVGLGHPLVAPLSETDSKALAAAIFEQTGLVVGGKSLKNYSFYVLNGAEGKKENPSVATLDTLARFVLRVPFTDEVQRKTNESHYPYWFQYRNRLAAAPTAPTAPEPAVATARRRAPKKLVLLAALVGLVALGLWQGSRLWPPAVPADFTDAFASIAPDSLRARGWAVHHPDTTWWRKRSAQPGCLTLYTLPGDNWPAATRPAAIKNLLVRRIPAGCFSTEIHFRNFFPEHNWQQAGLLLSENDTFTGKVIRLSLSYNDYFGGYPHSPEILVQGISSTEADSRSKPEEFVHVSLFALQHRGDSLVAANLRKSALKIEKKGRHFRFLYTTGATESFAFKEVSSGDFAIEPRYVALFAIQGFAPETHIAPVFVDFFGLVKLSCEE